MMLGMRAGRGLVAFASGAAVTVLATRLLPPLAAQFAGTAMGVAGGDPFQALAHDHRVVLSMLDGIEEAGRFDRTQRLLRIKRRLAAHALAEEDIVYPLLHDDAERAEHTRQLYAEHADLKILLHALEHISPDRPQWVKKAQALRDLIESHAHQEEEVLFPGLRDRLDEAELSRLYGEIRREKALIL